MPDAWLGLGSNLGDKRGQPARGARRACRPGDNRRCLAAVCHRVGPVEQDWFLNACARIETDLGAVEMLGVIAGIESNLGRERKIPNGPRTIDIDLLLYADLIVESAALTVPHPRLHLRRFVLEPLAAIAPDLMHPRLRKSIADLLKEQPPSPAVRLARGGVWLP